MGLSNKELKMTNNATNNGKTKSSSKNSHSGAIGKATKLHHHNHQGKHHSSSIASLLANTSSTISDKSAYKSINKLELINLMIQSLNDLGLKKSSKLLKEESSVLYGEEIQSLDDAPSASIISDFLNLIKAGRFDEAAELVSQLSLRDDFNDASGLSDVYWSFTDFSELSNKPYDFTSSGDGNGDMAATHKEALSPSATGPLTATERRLADDRAVNFGTDKAAIQKQILFLLKKQKFFEALLLHKNSKAAVNILRTEISQSKELNNQKFPDLLKEINFLSSVIIDENTFRPYLAKNGFIFKKSQEIDASSLKKYETKARSHLINEVAKFISPNQLIPPHRLATLLEQAKLHQQSRNLLTLGYQDDNYEKQGDIGDNTIAKSNSNGKSKKPKSSRKSLPLKLSSPSSSPSLYVEPTWSLYDNYKFPAEKFPCKVLQTLTYFHKQVWFVKFSHNGKYLAVISQDKSIVLYNVGDFNYEHGRTPSINPSNFRIHKVLKGHTNSPLYCSWSSDDSKLLSSGFDSTARIWDVKTGKCLQTINIIPAKNKSENNGDSKNEEVFPVIRTCEWLPNGRGFVAGSDEKELVYYDSKGVEQYRWSGVRILDLCVTRDSKKLITISKSRMDVWDLTTKKKIREVVIGKKLTALLISQKNPNQVLIHVSPDSIQLWDWNKGVLIKKFVGQKQEEYVIRSCFGGADNSESLVISGSEDGKIYMWNTKFAALVLGLKGHLKLVNCVDYNPRIPWMFASGSDDETVNIWGPEEALQVIKRRGNDYGKEFDEDIVEQKKSGDEKEDHDSDNVLEAHRRRHNLSRRRTAHSGGADDGDDDEDDDEDDEYYGEETDSEGEGHVDHDDSDGNTDTSESDEASGDSNSDAEEDGRNIAGPSSSSEDLDDNTDNRIAGLRGREDIRSMVQGLFVGGSSHRDMRGAQRVSNEQGDSEQRNRDLDDDLEMLD